MKLLLVSLILVNSMKGFSQANDLANRIFSYQDSTKVLIKNSRRLILDLIKNGDYVEADRIKDYVEDNVDNTQYALFTTAEDFLISYNTNDFSRILITIRNWNSFNSAPYYAYLPENDKLYENILKLSLKDSKRINKSISELVASREEQEVLKIVLRSILSFDPESGITQESLNEDVEKYLGIYETSPYNEFLKENVRLKYENKWGYSVFMGAGFGGINGGLSEYIESFTPALLGMEFYFRRKIFLGYRLQGGGGKTLQEFTYNGVWPEGMRVNPLYIGLTGGYTFLDLKKIRIAGLVDMGGISITPVDEEKTPETKNLKLNSFTYGPSFFLDYYPFAANGVIGETRIGLRFQGGILLMNYDNKDRRFGGDYPYFGISFVLDLFEKRIVKD